MYGVALFPVVAALGMRHGADPDHLVALDGLSRFHPSRWNGVLFAIGHGALVTLLAVGFGSALSKLLEPYSVWILLAIGLANLWRLWKPYASTHHHRWVPGFAQASPLLLGVLFAMGFETASQLSAFLLAGKLDPWMLGIVFTAGMVIVDGADGFLAARVQRSASRGQASAIRSSRILSLIVALFSFGFAGAEVFGYDVDKIALPLGLGLFCTLVVLRLWTLAAPDHREGTSSEFLSHSE